MDAPFTVAFTPMDLRRAMQEYAGYDRIFVDPMIGFLLEG